MTLALVGYATRWGEVIHHLGQYKMILPGAFDSSLRLLEFAPVRLHLNHFDDQCVGSTDDNLQLYSDEHGLAFRFKITETENGERVRSMAEDHNCMSVGFGWDTARKETRSINGVDTVCIISAKLFEISFMSGFRAGAVRNAFAVLKNADYTKSLKEESSDFLYETAAINFKRSLDGLMRACDGY